MPDRTRKPRGRPRKGDFDIRDARVTVRFKAGEAAQLDLFAKEAGLTPPEFIRSRTLGDRPAPGISPDLKHDLYRLLLAVQRGLRDGIPAAALADRMQAVIDRIQA